MLKELISIIDSTIREAEKIGNRSHTRESLAEANRLISVAQDTIIYALKRKEVRVVDAYNMIYYFNLDDSDIWERFYCFVK